MNTVRIACLAAMCLAALAVVLTVLWDCRKLNKRAQRRLEGFDA